jgi:hypothetical protein
MFSAIDGPGGRRLVLLGMDSDGVWYRVQNPASRLRSLSWLAGPFMANTLAYPDAESLDRICNVMLRLRFQLAAPTKLPVLIDRQPYTEIFQTRQPSLPVLEAVALTQNAPASGQVITLERALARVVTFTFTAETNTVALRVMGEATAGADAAPPTGGPNGTRAGRKN